MRNAATSQNTPMMSVSTNALLIRSPRVTISGMKTEKPALSLDDIELYPDAMERTERAIKAVFRTGHVSKDAIKKTVAAKRRKAKRATRRP
jgi:hypothetical protein